MKIALSSKLSVLALAVVFTGCCCLGRMTRNADAVSYKVNPAPLEAHCDEIEVEVTAEFPPKYFDRKTTIDVTPMLVGENGATAKFESFSLQGEKVAGNNTVIPFKSGGSYTFKGKVPYKEGLDYSDLEMNITLKKGTKNKVLDPYQIAVGTITTPYLVQNDDRVLIAKDKFQRVTEHKQEATVNYAQNSSYVRPNELRDADIKELEAFVAEAAKNENITITGVEIQAYASPEGELRFNENLAEDRAESARKVVARILKRKKIDTKADNFFNNIAKGEDWLGFKAEMEKSKIEDKELILRILTMYDDLAKREQEIRNLSKTYTEVADKILPGLRRSQIDVNYKVQGKTDEEILSLAKSNPVDLNVEELLYAATLTSDNKEKLAFYTAAQNQFPADYRGFNNAGVIEFKMGNTAKAKNLFNEAKKVNASAEVHNNLGVIARLEGRKGDARKHFEAGLAAGKDVKYNTGILDIQECRYGSAVTNMAGENTFNAALAAHLDGKNDKAIEVLNAAGNKDAKSHYLYAVVYGDMGNEEKMVAHLKESISADASMKAKAAKDRAFYQYRNNSAFTSVVK
ncbi:TPR end-of-group domain-containing protein [Luteibaculum oceani]|uniref:Tetratricopeptide repeat protein n=1 Tax=Luteibaculum oceani TaxID=1294296 RepID=A0A5C6VB00_9FLAO|nr:hypothetical protein [Luteibaculum oceani]TXC81761.1 hypothetical protein FRX97_04390 [Luteibaculum oceani]